MICSYCDAAAYFVKGRRPLCTVTNKQKAPVGVPQVYHPVDWHPFDVKKTNTKHWVGGRVVEGLIDCKHYCDISYVCKMAWRRTCMYVLYACVYASGSNLVVDTRTGWWLCYDSCCCYVMVAWWRANLIVKEAKA